MKLINNLISKLQLFIGMAPDKLFYEGQEITLKEPTTWYKYETGSHHYGGPKYNEIVKVLKYGSFFKGQWYLLLEGYGLENEYLECQFVAVIQDDQLEEMLNEIDELTLKPQMS